MSFKYIRGNPDVGVASPGAGQQHVHWAWTRASIDHEKIQGSNWGIDHFAEWIFMNHQRALLLINRKARRGREELNSAIRWLEQHNFALIKPVIKTPHSIPELIKRFGPEVDIVIIGGGDGTLNRSLEALLEVDRPLGVLPLGTANDLARTLTIPGDLHQACEVIARGHRCPIDLGCVNGKHYLNVASIGLSVRVTEYLTGDIKRRWGALGYVVSLVKAYRAMHPHRVTVSYDDRNETFRSIQVAIGNGRFYGGGMLVHDTASISDGCLNLYSIQPQSLWRLIVMLPFLRFGHQELWRGIQHRRGQIFRVSTRRPMRINTDGELTTATPAQFSVKPKALPVLVPSTTEWSENT